MSLAQHIILDANLLVLWVVGRTSVSYIDTHRRLRAYTDLDFLLLEEILGRESSVHVTPNTLTEASNLLASTPDPPRGAIFQTFSKMIGSSKETFVESHEISLLPEFVMLGLTDAVLLRLNKSPKVLLTADLDLWAQAQKQGLTAYNFNHFREAYRTV